MGRETEGVVLRNPRLVCMPLTSLRPTKHVGAVPWLTQLWRTAPQNMPPIIAPHGRIADGHHRNGSAWAAGLDSVWVLVD
jgi:hypothetical protein